VLFRPSPSPPPAPVRRLHRLIKLGQPHSEPPAQNENNLNMFVAFAAGLFSSSPSFLFPLLRLISLLSCHFFNIVFFQKKETDPSRWRNSYSL
jgi:hypothetical protein